MVLLVFSFFGLFTTSFSPSLAVRAALPSTQHSAREPILRHRDDTRLPITSPAHRCKRAHLNRAQTQAHLDPPRSPSFPPCMNRLRAAHFRSHRQPLCTSTHPVLCSHREHLRRRLSPPPSPQHMLTQSTARALSPSQPFLLLFRPATPLRTSHPICYPRPRRTSAQTQDSPLPLAIRSPPIGHHQIVQLPGDAEL